MSLEEYQRKRDFDQTAEPAGSVEHSRDQAVFVVHKHDASRLHYDLRLEVNGVLKSWAVPKGPSLDPNEKRLAVEVEDHPMAYRHFEGIIPSGQYGAGPVIIWDQGTWLAEDSAEKALKAGKLSFRLYGEKLGGGWTLVRMRGQEQHKSNWLLIKAKDEHARASHEGPITEEKPASVLSGRTVQEVAEKPAMPDQVSTSAMKSGNPPDWREIAKSLGAVPLSEKPTFVKPQLATLVDHVPEGLEWLHEVKFDGYRLVASLDSGQARLFTRNQNDWSEKFPTICEALGRYPVDQALLDGEVVALNDDGISNFQRLQNIGSNRQSARVYFYVFDLPICEGMDLRDIPLVHRKELLYEIIAAAEQPVIRYSQHTEGRGKLALENACMMGLEGIISKAASSVYLSERTDTWRKSKCYLRQEFVVAGFTDPKGSRSGFGALLLGYFEDDQLRYAGRVGTGFSDRDLEEISKRLVGLESDRTYYDVPPKGAQLKGVHWIKPTMVAEIQFAGWTDDQLVRQASFQGLRFDKDPKEVHRESPEKNQQLTATIDKVRDAMNEKVQDGRDGLERNTYAGIKLSSPGRIMYPEQGVTKAELARYYELVADRILPHVVDRPLSLLRCPRGHEKKCFFQKNYTESIVGPIDEVELTEESGERATYMAVSGLPGLIQLVQLGTLELHPWASKVDRLDRPDMLIFDLDPGPPIKWPKVKEAAERVRSVLSGHGLQSFVKTSGGKGLHVIVPLERRAGWDRVRNFARAIAAGMAKDAPAEYTASPSKKKREGKIFIDYMRNTRGATNVAPYSTRAREGAPISMPIRWDQLDEVNAANTFTVTNFEDRFRSLDSDPWEGFFSVRQSVTKPMMEAVGE